MSVFNAKYRFVEVSYLSLSLFLIGAVELDSFNDIDSVFDDGFFNQLDESHFDLSDEVPFDESSMRSDLKRKRSSYENVDYLVEDSFDDSSYSDLPETVVSPSYDIERNSPEHSPQKKRMRRDLDFEGNSFVSSSWDSSSDDSWDMLPAIEDMPASSENDSWKMTPQQNMELPFATESKNPIGHILSNGIRTIHDPKTTYRCRACDKDLKGHQQNPTMHFMLPKHENCWQKITEDMHLSDNISKAVYPPQYMEKTAKKDVFACKKCGQTGSKRKILSHVMGAKCKPLRKTYSDALAWSGIEDSSVDATRSNASY
mmetsp:Transcript_39177/g.62009  ORF Transcript_39177/g.62009 Transcript_39177/m.62009 type:complete len:314 (-) Transcript_39177:64-1005(-)|eukprot:CAMPEP_0201523178 /NCGR_PEP_ID=MMETSP0161_2-20130828/18860_1 /ASSEMBLY_ACC=CAM_ASM_000251 /TAXON_ID=180227 /ORGANISM="Neoparamoeba aestuarina, Strain SoJaBio B1-5/56/2" /LENGTH=313 /DNA_ID=CAMNT_0047922199 /DNA_START=62 /DNA_END=1003 /DNA_ORIENTATION=+